MDPRFRREILDILRGPATSRSQPCARTAIRRRRRSATRTTILRSTSAPVLARRRRKTSAGTQGSPPPSTFPIATGVRSGVFRCLERRSGSPTRPRSLVLKSFSCGGFRRPSPSMHRSLWKRHLLPGQAGGDFGAGLPQGVRTHRSGRVLVARRARRGADPRRWPDPTAQLTDAPATGASILPVNT